MRLALFNGSPRMQKSNSGILIRHFLTGYGSVTDAPASVDILGKRKRREMHLKHFQEADHIIIVFPLYTDCMPGIVKEFFEDLTAGGYGKGKHLGFIVQSGFPESIHSVYVGRYLEKLCKRLNAAYIGTIIKGGVEGIQIMPPLMTRKLRRAFEESGAYFGETGRFSAALNARLGKPRTFSPLRKLVMKIMSLTGMANFYWDSQLKKHGAFERRFAAPFSSERRSVSETE